MALIAAARNLRLTTLRCRVRRFAWATAGGVSASWVPLLVAGGLSVAVMTAGPAAGWSMERAAAGRSMERAAAGRRSEGSKAPGSAVSSAPGSAATPGGGSPAQEPAFSEEHRQAREELRQKVFEDMRVQRSRYLATELTLDNATSRKLEDLLGRFDEQEREQGRERFQVIRALRQELAAAKVDRASVDALVERLVANRARRNAIEQERTAAIRKLLPPPDAARLLLLLPRFEEDFRHRMHEAIDRARREAEARGEVMPFPERWPRRGFPREGRPGTDPRRQEAAGPADPAAPGAPALRPPAR